MIQLDPGEIFAITRQLDDPNDTNTNYVQVFIRDARTDSLIDTIQLTDKGNQRFRGTWEVEQDTSGLGTYITITSKVYTDSGYTTLHSTYAILEEEYLIQSRYNREKHYAGRPPGPSETDYERIKKIVIDNKPTFEQHKVSLEPLAKSIASVNKGIYELNKAIKSIKIPEYKETDFNPVILKVIEGQKLMGQMKEDGIAMQKMHADKLDMMKEVIDSVKENISQEFFENVNHVVGELISKVTDMTTQVSLILQGIDGMETQKKLRKLSGEIESISSGLLNKPDYAGRAKKLI